MSVQRASQLTIGYSSAWKKQSAWDTPLANSDIDRAFPATSRNYVETEETTEEIFDCTGEDYLFEIVTGATARLTIDFDVDPELVAGMDAFAKGVAMSPTGGTNEVQAETITATSGTRTLTVQKGANAQTTTPIAYNANAAAIQAALEALSNVDVNDIVVSGTGPFTYTFSGTNYQKQDVNLITVNTFNLAGGTSTFNVSTPGVGLLHDIRRLVAYTLPLMTLYIGFRGSSNQPVIFKNIVVNSIRVRAASREKVTCTVELIGSADLQTATGYTMPPCTDIVPIRFGDCKMSIGGTDFIAAALGREFEYFYQNDVVPKFDGAGIYATRHERADKRPSGLNMFVLGEPGDSIYNVALAKATLDCFVQCGPDGRMIKFEAPQGLVKLTPQRIRFGGDPPESEVGIVVRPKKVTGDSTTPWITTARTSQATAYLASA